MNPTTAANIDELQSTSRFRLLLLSLVLVSPALIYGLNISLPTVAMPQLNLSLSAASWFVSIAVYVAPVSSILAGVIIDKFGRKTVLVYSILPSFAGWALLYWNYNDYVLLSGQMLNGLTIGAVLYPMQVYAGECLMVGNVRLRNSFMVWIGICTSLGTFTMIGLSNFLNYYEICQVAFAVAATLLAVFLLVIPESPPWLRLKGRHGDADWSEKQLGVAPPILGGRPESTTVSSERRSSPFRRSLNTLTRPDVYKPMLILSAGSILQPTSGPVTVVLYMINIIADEIPGQATQLAGRTNGTLLRPSTALSDVPVDANLYGLLCSVFMIAGGFTSSLLLPVAGMKSVLITSNISAIFGLVTLTYCTLDAAVNVLVLRVGAICLLQFIVGVVIGPSMVVAGDMFPVDGKGFAAVPIVLASLSSATANKIFPYLYLALGGYAYCVYAFVSALGALYVYFLLPEVVGKTLNQINKEFFA